MDTMTIDASEAVEARRRAIVHCFRSADMLLQFVLNFAKWDCLHPLCSLVIALYWLYLNVNSNHVLFRVLLLFD